MQPGRRGLLKGPDWYRHAVVYEVYVRSFKDSNGDGIGDRETFGIGALKVLTADDPSVLIYTRASHDEQYVVVIGDEGDMHTAMVADANLPGDGQLLFGDATLERVGAKARVTVPTAGMAVFRVR